MPGSPSSTPHFPNGPCYGNLVRMSTFQVGPLSAALQSSGRPYNEFLRVPALSVGLYRLTAGSQDRQQPHGEDEVYYALSGRGRLR